MLTKKQLIKTAKALVYAFVSSFLLTIMTTQNFNKSGLIAAATAGINAVLVIVKQFANNYIDVEKS